MPIPPSSGGPPTVYSTSPGPRRPRYVDTFNTNAAPTPSKPRTPSNASRQIDFSGTIFTPKILPVEQQPQPIEDSGVPNGTEDVNQQQPPMQ